MTPGAVWDVPSIKETLDMWQYHLMVMAQVAATKDLEQARSSAAEQLQASQEQAATLQATCMEAERRLQAAQNDAEASNQQAHANTVGYFSDLQQPLWPLMQSLPLPNARHNANHGKGRNDQ